MNRQTILRYLGSSCFLASWIVFGSIFLIPLLALDITSSATLASGLFLTAEVLFWLSLLILGKPVINKLKRKLTPWNRTSNNLQTGDNYFDK